MLISFLVMLIFIVDMALYPFWGFKLDASIFLYMDSPKNALASVSTGFIILRIFIMLLLSALMIAGLYKLTPQRLAGTSRRVTGSAGMILLGGLLFVVIREV